MEGWGTNGEVIDLNQFLDDIFSISLKFHCKMDIPFLSHMIFST